MVRSSAGSETLRFARGVLPEDPRRAGVRCSAGGLLVGFALEWQDDLLDLIQNAGVTSRFPTPETDIDLFDRATERELKKAMPAVHPSPTQTQSWNLAYMEAIKANADIRTAEGTAWGAWRFAMDQRAAMAYNKVFKATGNRSSAMRAFWAQCPRDIPRPVDHIKAIQGNLMGLVLADNERRVDWHIAALKLKNGELEVSPKTREMLKGKLASVKAAAEFLALL